MSIKTPPVDNIPLGIGLTVLSVLVFGLQDAVSKQLVQEYSPFQISMMRYWAFAGFSIFLVWRQGPLREAFTSKMPIWQLARGVLLVADIWLFSLAIQTVPLAELHAIVHMYPLLVTLLAIPMLGETVGKFRIGAIIVGFFGALIIIRPGGLPLDMGVLYAAVTAFVFATYIICTRKVAHHDPIATSMVYVGVVGMIFSTAVGAFFWQPMDLKGLLMVGFVMVTTVTAHGLMMIALRFAPASTVQPFNYLVLPWAIVLSYLVFGHLIDFVSFIGVVIVAGAGLAIWIRERKRKVMISIAETTPADKA